MTQLISTRKFGALTLAIGLALGSGSALAQSSEREQGPTNRSTQSQNDLERSQKEHSSEDRHSPREQTAQRQSSRDAASGEMDFDELVQTRSDLSTFVKAVEAAGLDDSLSAGTQYTIFAPTNAAFEEMRGEGIDELMQSENRDQLISMLRAHIVADDVTPQQARTLDEAKTLDGNTVDLDMKDGSLTVGDAKVLDAEGIDIDNLRVYAIDEVLDDGREGPFAANR